LAKRGRPPNREGVPTKPTYHSNPNGKSVIAKGYLRLDGKTDTLQGTGPTKAAARDAYYENGEKRKTRRRSEVNDYTSDSKLRVVIDEWHKRQVTKNPRNRDQASLYVYFSEVFHSKDPRAPKNVIKIEDLAELTIREATAPKLIAHVDSILDLGYNAKAQRHRQLLIEIMEIPKQWGIIDTNPAEAIEEIPDKAAKPRGLNEIELPRLRSQLARWAAGEAIPGTPAGRVCDRDQTIPDIFEVGLALTIRPGEILGLVWEEPDREDGIPGGIDLDAVDENGDPAPYAWITGIAKQLRGHSITRQPHTKTGEDGIRCMPIPLWALPIFRRLYRDHLARPTPNPLKLVFPSRAGTVRYPNNVRRAWVNACGTEFAWVTLGTTRKTGAGKVMDKLGPKATAEQLGHTTEKNVKYYAVTPPRIVSRENAEALSELGPAFAAEPRSGAAATTDGGGSAHGYAHEKSGKPRESAERSRVAAGNPVPDVPAGRKRKNPR
jgi:integrase